MPSTPSSMSSSDTLSGHSGSPPYFVAPASRRHSDGGAGKFPTAPAMDYPNLPSPQQLLEQQEAKWHQLFQDYAEEFVDGWFDQSLECQKELYRRSDEWYEKCEKKDQKVLEQSVEIEHLIVESSPPVSLVFLTDIQATVLDGKTENMKLKENFNVRGALVGTNTPEFTKVLHDEVASRGLGLKAVTPCIALVYENVFQRARGNDFIITLYKGDYTANDGAVLAAFLRMQSEWPYGLAWREEIRKRQTKR
ncbi:hypothetical protein B9Z19DRAFT_1111771 [Tuber borchii]|uniref:Uncharacterized protein n=1 Tax=Tuber borchii TaxID=42251 RepID=A0A2T6ZA35_TUBBO|nr:hypothetical protein B9Z19DRAFT_1111771 [Tuber borchii]